MWYDRFYNCPKYKIPKLTNPDPVIYWETVARLAEFVFSTADAVSAGEGVKDQQEKLTKEQQEYQKLKDKMLAEANGPNSQKDPKLTGKLVQNAKNQLKIQYADIPDAITGTVGSVTNGNPSHPSDEASLLNQFIDWSKQQLGDFKNSSIRTWNNVKTVLP